MQQYVFLQLLVIAFISIVYESPHDDVNSYVFVIHILTIFLKNAYYCIFRIKLILLHI